MAEILHAFVMVMGFVSNKLSVGILDLETKVI